MSMQSIQSFDFLHYEQPINFDLKTEDNHTHTTDQVYDEEN